MELIEPLWGGGDLAVCGRGLVCVLSEYQLIRTRAESLTQSGWGRTVL